jgi:hypothetical protein
VNTDTPYTSLYRARILKLLRSSEIDFQGINSASLCSLASRYDNPIPTWFLAPIDCFKIPAQLFTGQSLADAGEREVRLLENWNIKPIA